MPIPRYVLKDAVGGSAVVTMFFGTRARPTNSHALASAATMFGLCVFQTAVCGCWLCIGIGARAEHPIQLRDVTDETGITFQHTDGGCGKYDIIEAMSCGLALFDYCLAKFHLINFFVIQTTMMKLGEHFEAKWQPWPRDADRLFTAGTFFDQGTRADRATHRESHRRGFRVAKHVRCNARLMHFFARSLLIIGAIGASVASRDGHADEVNRAPAQLATTVRQQADALETEQYAIANRLVADFPDSFDAYRILGFVHSSHGNKEEMFECWRKCHALQPDRADIHDQLGKHAMENEEYEQAIAYWQKALAIDPKFPTANERIGKAYLNLGRPEKAVAALRQELEIAPKSGQAFFLLGQAFLESQEFAKAKQNYLSAVRLNPKHKEAYYGLIKTCSRLRQSDDVSKYAKAFQELEKEALANDRVVRENYNDLQKMRQRVAVTCTDAGRIYHADDQADMAEKLWMRAAALDEQNVTCRSLLAQLYEQRQESAEALSVYEEIAVLRPRDRIVRRRIGFLNARIGNLSAAEDAFRIAVEMAPRSGAAHRALAKFYLNTNTQLAQAQELAVEAMKLEPTAESYFVLGWASAKNNNIALARKALDQAIRLAPDNATYRKLQQSIQRAK